MPLKDIVARKLYLAGYYLKHKEEIKARSSRRYENNRRKIKEFIKGWCERNPEKVVVYKRKYRVKPTTKLKHRQYKHVRRNREVGLDCELPRIEQWEHSWKSKDQAQCFWCRKTFHPKQCHTDHVVPLSREGKHELSNLVISCSTCNRRKRDKHPTVWIRQLNREIGREIDMVWCLPNF